jgi:anti-sigma-K factor RskA
MTHQELRDMTAAFALDALDGDERAAVDAHLPGCAECREAVASHRAVSGLLAYATAPTSPPNAAALRERILRDARQVRPLDSARGIRHGVPQRDSAGGGQLPESGRGTRRTIAGWLAAAACLTIAALSGLAYRGERAEVAQLRNDLVATRAEMMRRDSVVAAFLGPEVHVVSLSAPQHKPAMRVYWNHTKNVFIITAFDVPAAPAGKTYQLWGIQKGKLPLSMGTFNVDGSGRALAVVPVPPNVTEAGFIDDCGLTMEPAGGSAQPTEAPRLVGPWRHVD